MRKSICISFVSAAILIVSLAVAPCTCFSQDIPDVVRSTLGYVQKGAFKDLSFLYLLPSDYSESKKNKERQGIEDALNLLADEFGSVGDLRINQGKAIWVNLEIFGGDADFIKRQPNFSQYVFITRFSKLGHGFIVVRLYENKGNPKLRSVGYALPDSPHNRGVMKAVGIKLMGLMFQEIP